MQKKALVVALVSMLIGGILLELYLRSFESQACGGAKVTVLVATEDLPAGDTLTHEKIGLRELPEAYVESRHVRAGDIDRVLGTTLALTAKAGDALLWSDIAGMSARRRTLSALVSGGMRAFTLRAAGGAFGGLLEPGDRVDVLTNKADESTPLVENAVVLAVGERLEAHVSTRDQDTSSARDADITLRVTPEQGRTLAQVAQRGELRLLLRNPEDVLTTHAHAVEGVKP